MDGSVHALLPCSFGDVACIVNSAKFPAGEAKPILRTRKRLFFRRNRSRKITKWSATFTACGRALSRRRRALYGPHDTGGTGISGARIGARCGDFRRLQCQAGRIRRDHRQLLELDDFITYSFFAIQIGHTFFPAQSEYGSLMLSLIVSLPFSAFYAAFTEALPRRIRGGVFATIYAVAIASFGGTAQLVVAWLIHVSGNPLAAVWYLLFAGVVGLIAMILMRETAPAKLGWA